MAGNGRVLSDSGESYVFKYGALEAVRSVFGVDFVEVGSRFTHGGRAHRVELGVVEPGPKRLASTDG